jgi:hypothetical protein
MHALPWLLCLLCKLWLRAVTAHEDNLSEEDANLRYWRKATTRVDYSDDDLEQYKDLDLSQPHGWRDGDLVPIDPLHEPVAAIHSHHGDTVACPEGDNQCTAAAVDGPPAPPPPPPDYLFCKKHYRSVDHHPDQLELSLLR